MATVTLNETSPFSGQIFEISADVTEPLMIENFDITKDVISLVGTAATYAIETVDGDLQISSAEGTLLATLTGVTELSPYQGSNPEGTSYLISLENEFFDTYIEPYFFEPIYPVQNSDVDALIASGEYESYYDHFINAGQFEEREDTFLAATEGNDTLYSLGYETVLVGVPITQAQYRGGLDVVPLNTGTGQIDTLYGGVGKEAIFVLGNSNILNDTAQSFYLGNGNEDYALIKNFLPGDRIFLGSEVTGFTQTVVDGNLHISKEGDLITIVENRTELVSEREHELTSLATESYTVATDGNDTVSAAHRRNNVIGVPVTLTADNQVIATSLGANQVDTLMGAKGANSFILGIAITPDGTPQPLYIGNGDEDYALIQDFSNKDTYDSVTLAGKVSDYKFEFEAYEGTGNDTKIFTEEGDLVAIVENVPLSQFYVEGAGITLYAVSPQGTTEEVAEYLFDIEPFFYEDFYLAENPEVAALISSGEYGSAFEHYIEVGQFAAESEVIFAGTSGDDFIPSMGKSDLLFGVPLTFVDGTLEGWEEASTGVGEQDTLVGGLGVTTFFIGNDQILDSSKPNEVYYLGEGDEDYALIQGFQPTQDFIFAAGAIADYTLETIDGDLNISYGGDLVAIVDDAGGLTLQEFDFGDARPNAFAFVAPENEFLPSEPESPFGRVIQVGAGEPLTITDFEPTQDVIQLLGFYEDYIYANENGNLIITTTAGDLVATVENAPELNPYRGNNPASGTYLLSLENEFFEQNIEPAFYETTYPIQNPGVDALIAAGKFDSYYDHFLQVGQFTFQEDTFFQGTTGNDTLYGIGAESLLVGVPIEDAQYDEGIDVVASNTGTGQVDTLVGGSVFEVIFVVGNSNLLNENAQAFYIGNGDADYALIKNLRSFDRIFLGDDPAKFMQEVVDGSLQISKDGDLVAIVEGRTELLVDNGEGNELGAPSNELFIQGTAGNDTILTTTEATVAGVSLIEAVYDFDFVPGSLGVGEIDSLRGNERGNSFLLGTNNLLNETATPLYVGQGNQDYALIRDFSQTDYAQYDNLVLAGKPYDYTYEQVDGVTRLATKAGDLVAILAGEPNLALTPYSSFASNSYLYSGDNVGVMAFYSEANFYTPSYLDQNPGVAGLIESGEYESAFEHYVKVGQFNPEGEPIWGGTSGNDAFHGFGNADRLIGVELTSVDGETESWTTASTGVGEVDLLGGGLGTTFYLIGNDQILDPSKPLDVYYVGEGDEDYATIANFDPYKDFIFAAGDFADYTIAKETNPVIPALAATQTDLKISYQGDLVAVVSNIGNSLYLEDNWTLQEFDFGDARPNAFAFVAPQNEVLSAEPKTIIGTDEDDVLGGNGGDDTVAGNLGNDDIFGGDGNDILRGDQNSRDAQTDLLGGDDTISGGAGDDRLGGKSGNDVLSGDDGNDAIWGDAGDDLIRGGLGDDRLWGGTGSLGGDIDTFVLAVGEGTDTIIDFEVGLDQIGLTNGLMAGALSIEQSGNRTQISVGDETLAFLRGVDAAALLASDPFVSI